MRHSFMLIVSVFLLFIFSFPICAQVDYSNEILVYFTKGITKEKNSSVVTITDFEIRSVLDKYEIGLNEIFSAFPDFNEKDTLQFDKDFKPIKLPNMSRIFKIKIPSIELRKPVIDELSNLPNVLFAEINGIADLDVVPDDTYFSNQWGLKNGTSGKDIHATQAWDIYKGNSNNYIGIIDHGIISDHPDLSGKVTGDNGNSGGHGTHVAGIAAAKTNNDQGVAGVDWYAKLHSQRIDGRDDTGIYNAIVDAVNYNSNVNVLNNSWGLEDNNGNYRYSSTVRMAFAYAYKHNRVAIATMGNDDTDETRYPAGFGQGIIAVGATTSCDARASYSNTGNHIDVSAPGSNIYSTYTNDGYVYLYGTSMAAPHVSGISSLLKGYKSNLYNDDIENIIRISTDDVNLSTYPGWDQYLGTGRVNAENALNYLRSPYVLSHKSASGGSTYSNTGTYTAVMYGVPGLADGVYIVKRYEVRKYVNFGQTYQNTNVWGRGVGTNGCSAANPNYGMGYCDVVSNNNSSATLRTFVYKIWTINGQYVGYKPTSPSNVSFNYTVLGTIPPLSVSISGPASLGYNEQGTFTANQSGGKTPYTNYRWWERKDDEIIPLKSGNIILAPPSGYWIEQTGWEGQQTVQVARSYNFSLKCEVTDSDNNTATDIHSVVVSGGLAKAQSSLGEFSVVAAPEQVELTGNYPNPFNPSTSIRFGVPEDSHIQLTIYSITGQKVLTVANGSYSAGYHEIKWDGRNVSGNLVSNGIYIYELRTGNQRLIKKMVFAK